METRKILERGSTQTIFEIINEFSRQNIISKNKNSNVIKEFSNKVSIFETNDPFIKREHEMILNSYKTKPFDKEKNSDILDKLENYENGLDRRRE